MLTRKEILNKAYHDCMHEMYAKSQPEADYDNLIEEYCSGKIGKNEPVYNRHYLSMDEFLYIRNKYKEAYNIKKTWNSNIEFLEQLLREGGLKDKYNPAVIDEDGFKHPGYRSAEDVKPLKDQISDIIKEFDCSEAAQEIAEIIYNKVIDTIESYKDFYRFDREEDDFDCNIALGASPCSNADTVKKWWKENYNQDIEIEEHNPRLFWYRDMEYTDEDLISEFGSDNWKEIVDKEWEEEKSEKKRKKEEELKALKEEYSTKYINENEIKE